MEKMNKNNNLKPILLGVITAVAVILIWKFSPMWMASHPPKKKVAKRNKKTKEKKATSNHKRKVIRRKRSLSTTEEIIAQAMKETIEWNSMCKEMINDLIKDEKLKVIKGQVYYRSFESLLPYFGAKEISSLTPDIEKDITQRLIAGQLDPKVAYKYLFGTRNTLGCECKTIDLLNIFSQGAFNQKEADDHMTESAQKMVKEFLLSYIRGYSVCSNNISSLRVVHQNICIKRSDYFCTEFAALIKPSKIQPGEHVIYLRVEQDRLQGVEDIESYREVINNYAEKRKDEDLKRQKLLKLIEEYL